MLVFHRITFAVEVTFLSPPPHFPKIYMDTLNVRVGLFYQIPTNFGPTANLSEVISDILISKALFLIHSELG